MMNRYFLRKVLVRRMPALTVLECENGREAVDLVEARLAAGQPLHVITMGARLVLRPTRRMPASRTALSRVLAAAWRCADQEMPVMRGHEATQAIRAVAFGGIIVGVSGNAMASDVETFLAVGADAVLPKPMKVDDLLAIIKRRGRW